MNWDSVGSLDAVSTGVTTRTAQCFGTELTHSRKQTAASFKVGKHNNKVWWICVHCKYILTSILETKHSCVVLSVLFSSPSSSLLLSLSFTHTERERSKHTHICICSWQGVSRSRWRTRCLMLNHPSVAACLRTTPGTRHTNATTKPGQTSTLRRAQDDESNSDTLWEERSQPRHQTKTGFEAAEQLTSLLASAFHFYRICD